MSKLLPSIAIGLSLTVFPLAAVVLPASAEEDLVTVTIGGAFAEALSTATGVPLDGLPGTVQVPAGVASTVCGAAVEAGGTCAGATAPEALAPYLDNGSSSSSSSSSTETSSSSSQEDHSAKAFAPGQLKADGESAKAYAPGQTKGEGESARESAPGHQKNGEAGNSDGGKKS